MRSAPSFALFCYGLAWFIGNLLAKLAVLISTVVRIDRLALVMRGTAASQAAGKCCRCETAAAAIVRLSIGIVACGGAICRRMGISLKV